MVTIEIKDFNSSIYTLMKTTKCPKCGTAINSWDWPVKICRSCNFKLVNISDLIVFKSSRIKYHKEGPY